LIIQKIISNLPFILFVFTYSNSAQTLEKNNLLKDKKLSQANFAEKSRRF